MKNKGFHAFFQDHFIPHHGNKHTPHALGHGALLAYSVGMVLLKFGALCIAIALPAASLYSSAITPINIISLTNASRSSLELPVLAENSLLDASAQAKAEDMLAKQYFAHTSPTGLTPWSWIKGGGYSYKYAGENLAVYFSQAEDVEAGWMASPTHRANIVDTKFTDIGVGVAQGEYNGYPAVFVVQHFGKLATMAEPAPPAAAVLSEQIEIAASEPAVTVIPQKDSYAVALKAPDATAVSAHLGNTSIALTKTGDNTWQGSVPAKTNELSQNGEQLTLVVSDKNGQSVESAAIVAPTATAQDMYAFENKTPQAKVFGLSLNGLQDNVTQIYLITIAVLAALLFVTLMAKMHWKRLPLAAHVFAVIGIAVLLMAI